MKAVSALYLLKKNGLIPGYVKLSHLKFCRRVAGHRTWEAFVREIMLGAYLLNSVDLTQPIRIPEVGMAIGGTQHLEVRRVGERDDGEPVYSMEDRGTW